MLKYGIDLGFDSTKIVNSTVSANFPSVLAARQDSVMDIQRKGIVFDTPSVYVGDVALKYGDPPIHLQDDGWIHSDEFLHLFLAAITEGTPETCEITCVVGLPLSTYKAGKQTVIDRFQTCHRVKREGREEQLLDVVRVIPLPQGIGAGYREAFDEHGRIAKQGLLDGTFGVIDIGSKNVNLAWVAEGQDVPHKTKALERGCWQVVDALTKLLDAKLDRTLTPYQVRDALQTRIIRDKGKPVDCAPEVTQAIATVAPALLADIKAIWKDWKALDAIFISGGGSFLFGGLLMQEFSTAKVSERPIMANAEGFARYAHFITEVGA